MEITLKIQTGNKIVDENKNEIDEIIDKTFVAPFINGRKLKDTMSMASGIDVNNINAEIIDQMAAYIVDIYGKQFTIDEFYDGIEADKILSTFKECVDKVTGKLVNKSQQLEFLQGKNA